MVVWLLATALAGDANWPALLEDTGWTESATPKTTETGRIELRTKKIDGIHCLRGDATVKPTADQLIDVAADIADARFRPVAELLDTFLSKRVRAAVAVARARLEYAAALERFEAERGGEYGEKTPPVPPPPRPVCRRSGTKKPTSSSSAWERLGRHRPSKPAGPEPR